MTLKIQRPGARATQWRGGPLWLVAIAAIAIGTLAALTSNGPFGFTTGETENPTPPPSGAAASASASPAPTSAAIETPSSGNQASVVSRGVWFSEVAFEQWIAGQIGSGRTIRLPHEDVPIGGGSGLLVTVVRTATQTRVSIWDMTSGNAVVQAKVPFNVGGAGVTVDGSTVYLAGVTGEQEVVDAGVVALSIDTGATELILAPSPLRPEWDGNAGRTLVLSPSGETLATTLCGGPANSPGTCEIHVLDLATGSALGVFGPISLYLAAMTDDIVVARTQHSVVAFDFQGTERWRFDAGEIRGPIAAVPDGVILAYAAAGTFGPTRVARLSADSGAVDDLIVAEGEGPLSVWPLASDGTTVVVAEAPPMEFALSDRLPIKVSTIDAATGRVTPDAATISPEG